MRKSVSPADQVTRVATLLGRAVLRWKHESERSSEFSEVVSNSLCCVKTATKLQSDN